MEDSGLADLAAGCRNLTYVNLIGCILITDEGLRSLGALSKLQHLLLFRCKGVTDAGLHALGAGCPELKHINLYGLSNVTDVGVTALITKCPRLDHLRLHDMDLLTDASIDAMLPLRCPQMRRLAVGLCPGITDMALFGLEIANKTLVLETTQERTRF
jgi:F-box/leucine-rich repeat protein 2/20